MVYSIFDCFCQTRIASVKCLLGLLDEAVMVYNEILDEQSDYVPALKGKVTFLETKLIKIWTDCMLCTMVFFRVKQNLLKRKCNI